MKIQVKVKDLENTVEKQELLSFLKTNPSGRK